MHIIAQGHRNYFSFFNKWWNTVFIIDYHSFLYLFCRLTFYYTYTCCGHSQVYSTPEIFMSALHFLQCGNNAEFLE